jgi:hypothetical protein
VLSMPSRGFLGALLALIEIRPFFPGIEVGIPPGIPAGPLLPATGGRYTSPEDKRQPLIGFFRYNHLPFALDASLCEVRRSGSRLVLGRSGFPLAVVISEKPILPELEQIGGKKFSVVGNEEAGRMLKILDARANPHVGHDLTR